MTNISTSRESLFRQLHSLILNSHLYHYPRYGSRYVPCFLLLQIYAVIHVTTHSLDTKVFFLKCVRYEFSAPRKATILAFNRPNIRSLRDDRSDECAKRFSLRNFLFFELINGSLPHRQRELSECSF